MTFEIAFVLGLLIFALVSFWLEKFTTDQIALMVFSALFVAGSLPISERLPTNEQLLTVFANPAPLTIAAMFILSAALAKCGLIDRLASKLEHLTRFGYRWFLLALALIVASVSAFINNTPVVMVFLPAVMGLARSLGVPASKLLIPLSYASIFGGTCTLVGTSTNILASGILERQGYEPISMFELATVGLPIAFLGTLYLAFFSDKVLPSRESLTAILSPEERKEFITEAFVLSNSPLVGKTVNDAQLRQEFRVRVMEIIRDNVSISVDPEATRLAPGDRLVLACRPSGLAHARSIEGINFLDMKGVGLETGKALEGTLFEGIIGPGSSIVGQTIGEINFRQTFRVILMAIHRRGVNLRKEIDKVRIEPGDLLLMMGTDSAIQSLRSKDDILLLDHPRTPSMSQRSKAPLVLGILSLVILAASFNVMPIVAAAIIGVAAVFLVGGVKPAEGYANIEWSILTLIYGMLALGLAMQTTGAADLIARAVTVVSDVGFLEGQAKLYLVLAVLYICTVLLTETLSNNATIVLMAPIALSLGSTLGVDPRPFVIATCIAASASFSTPIGYQTNTYVHGVGGYRFSDFAKAGIPLNALYFFLSVLLIPRFWSF